MLDDILLSTANNKMKHLTTFSIVYLFNCYNQLISRDGKGASKKTRFLIYYFNTMLIYEYFIEN